MEQNYVNVNVEDLGSSVLLGVCMANANFEVSITHCTIWLSLQELWKLAQGD